MATTHLLISSNILSSTTASVTFSSIPQTFTDLVFYVVAATNTADTNVNLNTRVNSDTGANYGVVQQSFYGTASNFNEGINATSINQSLWGAGTTMTSNMFATSIMYLSDYTNGFNKQFSGFSGMSSSNTRSFAIDTAIDYRGTSAITEISIAPYSGSFLSGCSFYLYGIKNS